MNRRSDPKLPTLSSKAVRAWHAGVEVTTDSPATPVAMATDFKPPAAELYGFALISARSSALVR